MSNWKTIFVKMIFTRFGRYIALLIYAIKQPPTLFRYRAGNENDKDSLINNYIWLSNITEVNDEFEGLNEIRYNKVKLNYDFLREELKNRVDSIIEEVREKFYIACFTETETNDEMWKEYANKGQGYCVEYYFSDFKEFLFPVIYTQSKLVDIDDFDDNEMRRSLITKYQKWSKENEWRILWPYDEKKKKGKKIEQPKPKAIYMGNNISTDLYQFLMDYCNDNYIDLYQMKEDTNGNLYAESIS
ncbi:MAG: DUF2971 domain-containing protein [Tyzzerella sp.]|nr:DUF2971 domain-containing protein [Tyzzerella sp.]